MSGNAWRTGKHQRNIVWDEYLDSLVRRAAANEGISVTQFITQTVEAAVKITVEVFGPITTEHPVVWSGPVFKDTTVQDFLTEMGIQQATLPLDALSPPGVSNDETPTEFP